MKSHTTVVAIFGSYRRGGAVDAAVGEILAQAEQLGPGPNAST